MHMYLYILRINMTKNARNHFKTRLYEYIHEETHIIQCDTRHNVDVNKSAFAHQHIASYIIYKTLTNTHIIYTVDVI